MKVVINRCIGGFGVPPPIIIKLIEQNSKIVQRESVFSHFDEEGYTHYLFYSKDYGNGYKADPLYSFVVKDHIRFYIDSGLIEVRTDPDLIYLLETTDLSDYPQFILKVVEIPDDIQFTIEESDNGQEWVAEAHRKWW